MTEVVDDGSWKPFIDEDRLIRDIHELTGRDYVIQYKCHMEPVHDCIDLHFLKCSQCGGKTRENVPRYCPWCGSKVIK